MGKNVVMESKYDESLHEEAIKYLGWDYEIESIDVISVSAKTFRDAALLAKECEGVAITPSDNREGYVVKALNGGMFRICSYVEDLYRYKVESKGFKLLFPLMPKERMMEKLGCDLPRLLVEQGQMAESIRKYFHKTFCSTTEFTIRVAPPSWLELKGRIESQGVKAVVINEFTCFILREDVYEEYPSLIGAFF